MRKLFFMSLWAFIFVAAGCSKENENLETIPTENKTEIVDGNVVRTQTGSIYGYDAVVVITYLFKEIRYDHQEWKIYFHTAIEAMAVAQMLEIAEKEKATVTSKANTVLLVYKQGEGLGDDELSNLNTVDDLKNAVEGLEVLSLLKRD